MAQYELPDELRYTAEDEWLRVEDDRIVVGVTDYAQQQLGDVVFVELPEVGTTIERGEPFGVIESVKAVADLYAPASGEVVEVNGELGDHPEYVNEDCYGDGWMVAIAYEDAEEWEGQMNAEAYLKHCLERSDD